MQARGKGNSGGTCVWQMQSTSLPHRQEGARVAGVMANTGCCEQVGFLPLTTLFTSTMTHRCPTVVRAITASLPSPMPCTLLHYLPPPVIAMSKDTHPRRSSSALAKATTQSPAASTLTGMDLSLWIHSWKIQKDSWLLLSLLIKNSLH